MSGRTTACNLRADIVALPPLSSTEAVEFVQDLLRGWSVDKSLAPAPFDIGAVEAVVAELDDGSGLTPRTLIKAFDRILREGEFDIYAGERDHIDRGYALDILRATDQDDFT